MYLHLVDSGPAHEHLVSISADIRLVARPETVILARERVRLGRQPLGERSRLLRASGLDANVDPLARVGHLLAACELAVDQLLVHHHASVPRHGLAFGSSEALS